MLPGLEAFGEDFLEMVPLVLAHLLFFGFCFPDGVMGHHVEEPRILATPTGPCTQQQDPAPSVSYHVATQSSLASPLGETSHVRTQGSDLHSGGMLTPSHLHPRYGQLDNSFLTQQLTRSLFSMGELVHGRGQTSPQCQSSAIPDQPRPQ